jgi:hypothetical protein
MPFSFVANPNDGIEKRRKTNAEALISPGLECD